MSNLECNKNVNRVILDFDHVYGMLKEGGGVNIYLCLLPTVPVI